MNVVAKKLKTLAKVYNGATPKSDNADFWGGNIPWVTPVDLGDAKYLDSTKRNISEAGYRSCNTTLVEANNIVISNRAPIGLVAVNRIPVCTNQGCKALELDKTKIDKSYLYYVLKASEGKLNSLGTGTTFMEISSDALKNFQIPYVDLEQQKRLSGYLDVKTQTLDKILTAKNHTHTHLSELRQAIITELVYPDGGRVMSGSDQLYRHLLSQESGTWGEDPNGINEVKCLRVADFDYGHLSHIEPSTVRSIAPTHIRTKMLQTGDILIEKSGGGEKTPVGRAILIGKIDEPATYANFIDRLRFKNTVLPEYALYLLYAMYAGGVNTKYIKQNTGIQNLDIKHYLMEPVSIPDIDKQREIVSKIKSKLQKIDKADATLQKSISQLEEYRSSLISNVVGGKVEV